jgi:hypothetical protein
MAKRLKKHILAAGKLLLALGLLAWVFRSVDLRKLLDTLKAADPILMLAALVAFVVSLAAIAYRLRLLLRTQGIEIRLWELVRLTFLGQFFNSVVPGVVGGDLVKAYYLAKHTPHKGAVLVTVFVDRLMGLAELVLLAAVMILLLWASRRSSLAEMRQSVVATAVALAAVGWMLVFILSRRFRRLFHLQKIYSRLPVVHHVQSAGAAARRFAQRPGDLLKAMGITFVAQTMWIAGIAVAGRALAIQTPWYQYFLYVPLIYVIGAVPVTPGGAGLVEACYKLFFASAVVGDEQALALALTARVLDVVRGLPGLVVAITGAKLPPAEQLQAELDE